MEHPISKFISADSKRTKYFNADTGKESKGSFFRKRRVLQVWFETEPVQVELERLGYIQRLAEPVVVEAADILVGPATAGSAH